MYSDGMRSNFVRNELTILVRNELIWDKLQSGSSEHERGLHLILIQNLWLV